MAFVLAHDLGTTGNKATLFDADGQLVASHAEPYAVSYPQPGWAEQDPDDWWRAVCDSSRALIGASGVDAGDIAAVTFSGQMMGVVALDGRYRPLRSAIIWADQRAVEEAELIAEVCGRDEVYRRSGHRVSPAYTAAKMLWIKRHQPDIYAQTKAFVTAKDYAALRLTGVCATDYSDASGSSLFDLQSRTWCEDFIQHVGLDRAKLPPIHRSTDVIGAVTREASEATGLAAGTPVVIGGGDGACATVGAGVVELGDAYCVLGTSAWIAFTSDRPLIDPQQRTFTFHDLPPDRYVPMGTMQSAGGAREWFVRVAGEHSDAAIAAVEPGCNGLFFLPYLIGERSPWWDPHARGSFVGLTMNHGPVEMSRAVMEGVAFNLRLILNALQSQSLLTLKSLRLIGGGAHSAAWQQILADVLAMPIELPELLSEATSWGAAVAGGIGVGLYRNWGVAKKQARAQRLIEPNPHHVARYEELCEIFAATYCALQPIYQSLSNVR
jgi:xylulokinase